MKGCITAIITPFGPDGSLDMDGYRRLLDFQLHEGVSGIVVAGTTGEGPTVQHDEWRHLVSTTLETSAGGDGVVANTGSNSTEKTLEMTRESSDMGCRNVLMVDPYYNCPSSLEIRKEYYEPVAEAFPEVRIIPYVIPGRTGTQISPHDLSILYSGHPNVSVVKDATGSDTFARELRGLCGDSYSILSGDDDRTFLMMTDGKIRADGVISVISNIAPRTVSEMVMAANRGDTGKAGQIAEALRPLFQVVTVKTGDGSSTSPQLKFRNPVPVKTLARILGMPSGACRRPLGRLNRQGLDLLLNALRTVWEKNPSILAPIESSFGVSIDERLSNAENLEGLSYD